jgi:hypothetical protein
MNACALAQSWHSAGCGEFRWLECRTRLDLRDFARRGYARMITGAGRGLLIRMRHAARRTPPAATKPQADGPIPFTTPEAEAGQGEVLSSHHYAAGHDMHQAGSP